MPIIKKSTNNECWRGFREKRTLLHSWGNVNWCNHSGEPYGDFLKKKKQLNIELPYYPVVPLLGIYLGGKKHNCAKDICTPVFPEHYLQYPRHRSNLKSPLTEEWIKMYYLYTVEYSSAIKRTK